MRLLIALAVLCSTVGFAQERRRSWGEGGAGAAAFETSASGALVVRNQPRRPAVKSELLGWTLEGQGYEFRCDPLTDDCASALLRSRNLVKTAPSGLLLHREAGAPWRGVKVALRAELRAGAIKDRAALVLRAEDAQGNVLASSSPAPLTGTGSFRWHRAELLVPENAERLVVGVQLTGAGAVFVRELHLDDVEGLASAD
jgi:hypothetical protein